MKDERHLSSNINSSYTADGRFAERLRMILKEGEAALLEEKEQVLVLANRTAKALSRQLVSLGTEIEQMEEQINHHNKRLLLAKRSLKDRRALVASNFYTKHALTEQEDGLALLQSHASSYQRELNSLQRRKIELGEELMKKISMVHDLREESYGSY